MGLHFHYSPNFDLVRALARAGRLAGITIIDDTDFASSLVGHVPYVVLRKYGMEHRGYVEYGAAPGVIYQFDNEQQMDPDNDYYLDIMREADRRGRKVVIFNDAVGTTEDDRWLRRTEALKYAKAHGHFVGLHAYGDTTKGDNNYCPMTDPSSWRWFAGRYEHLYSLQPPEAQPDLILTECGAGGFQLNATLDQWLADVRRMNELAQRAPYLKAFNWWTMARPGLGFDRDILDDYVRWLLPPGSNR
jgi:hypothetical protein